MKITFLGTQRIFSSKNNHFSSYFTNVEAIIIILGGPKLIFLTPVKISVNTHCAK